MICVNNAVMQGSLIHGASSVLGSTPMDNSFIVLPNQKPPAQGILPRMPGRPDAGQPGKAMEESFVVVFKSESASDGGGTLAPLSDGGLNSPLQPSNSVFHSTISVLKRAFEVFHDSDTSIRLSLILRYFCLVVHCLESI